MRSAHSTSIAQPIGALIKRGQDERVGGVTRAPHASNEIRYIDWASESNGFTLESVCVCVVLRRRRPPRQRMRLFRVDICDADDHRPVRPRIARAPIV